MTDHPTLVMGQVVTCYNHNIMTVGHGLKTFYIYSIIVIIRDVFLMFLIYGTSGDSIILSHFITFLHIINYYGKRDIFLA